MEVCGRGGGGDGGGGGGGGGGRASDHSLLPHEPPVDNPVGHQLQQATVWWWQAGRHIITYICDILPATTKKQHTCPTHVSPSPTHPSQVRQHRTAVVGGPQLWRPQHWRLDLDHRCPHILP